VGTNLKKKNVNVDIRYVKKKLMKKKLGSEEYLTATSSGKGETKDE
jgi:hypothetical protein